MAAKSKTASVHLHTSAQQLGSIITSGRRSFGDALAEKYPSRPLGEISSFVNGTSYDRGKLVTGGKPIIRISNITDPSSDYLATLPSILDEMEV